MSTQDKNLTMALLMTPDMTNFSGHVHGGAILKLLDQVAYACAARYSRHYVVTASLDHVFFKEAIMVGELVTFKASINYVGRSSMEVGIKVISEDLKTNQQRHVVSCYFTMVAVDENGKSIAVTPLKIECDQEKRREEAARMRVSMRREIQQRNQQIHSAASEAEVK